MKVALANALPGIDAHTKLAQFGRKFTFSHDSPPKLAATLLLLYPKGDQIQFVLIQRQGHPKDPHQYQISFPGGSKEPQESFQETAIRETFEEIGVTPKDITILAPLSNVYVGASNFLIHPFVGYVDTVPTFAPQESEVKEILEIPLANLLDAQRFKHIDMIIRGHELKGVPYFDLADKIVWGATAMILNEFKEIVLAFDLL